MVEYELMDHTSDVGLRIFGADPAELFENAAQAMFDQIVDLDTVDGSTDHEISISGDDWSDLMVNWLRELLYLWVGKEILVQRAEILSISPHELTAVAKVDFYTPGRHKIRREIKAVTYHQIEVLQRQDRWESKVIFDV